MANVEQNVAVKYGNNVLALIDQGLVSASSFLVAVCIGRFGSAVKLGLYGLGTAVSLVPPSCVGQH